MGQRKSRKAEFLRNHPYCCFCGGSTPATTIDHVPPRVCFKDRAAPEGFEFPACDACQRATRLDELALGMFVRFLDLNPENYSSPEGLRLLEGIRNNQPHLQPMVDLSDEMKLAGLEAQGIKLPEGVRVSQLPMVAYPAGIDLPVDRYSRKLAAALFYREKGRPVPLDYMLWTQWSPPTNQLARQTFNELISITPDVTVGSRTNIPLGDRFGYRSARNENPDLFMALAQFGRGLLITMAIADGAEADERQEEGWTSVRTMFD